MAFPQYSGWPQPQPPPWSAYGSAWAPASMATATAAATAGLCSTSATIPPQCSPHAWQQAEPRPLEHSPYVAAAAMQHVPTAAQLGTLPPPAGTAQQMTESLAQVPAGHHQPPVWPLWSSTAATAASWYPQAGLRGAPATPAASSAALAAAPPAEGRVSGDASVRDFSGLATAASAVESEKENVPMGMNWGARMADSLLAPDTFPEAFKDRPTSATGLLLAPSSSASSATAVLAGSSAAHGVVAGVGLDERLSANPEEGMDQQGKLQDANFVEWRFHMILARQYMMEKDLLRTSLLKIRTVPAHTLPADIDGPLEPETRNGGARNATAKETSSQRPASVAAKAAMALPPPALAPATASQLSVQSSPRPQSLSESEPAASAGAFLLQLVKEPDKGQSADGAAEGAALLRQLQAGPQPQPSVSPRLSKGGKDIGGKGAALMQQLMGAGATNENPAVKDGAAEGAALLKQLQAGPGGRKDGAAEGAALLRQLQGAKEPNLAQNNNSTWEKDAQWEGGAKKDSSPQKEGGNKKRGKDRSHGKGNNVWW